MRNITLFIISLCISISFSTYGTTHTVTNTNDSGPGSLRHAVLSAAANDAIDFDAATDGIPILLTSGHINIDKGMVIQGNGREQTIIDGSANSSIFFIKNETGDSLYIADMTLQNGIADTMEGGGCFYLEEGYVHLYNAYLHDHAGDMGGAIFSKGSVLAELCEFANNTAQAAGAIHNDHLGDLTLLRSVIRDCSSVYSGGGIQNTGLAAIKESAIFNNITTNESSGGGGIFSQDDLLIRNSTIANNQAYEGGGLMMGTFPIDAPVFTILNSTISGNHARFYGGISCFLNDINMTNTIVAGNTSDTLNNDGHINSLLEPDIYGSHNLIGDSVGFGSIDGTSNLWNVDPLLDPLADNGGPTPTMHLRTCSPAINTGDDAAAPVLDQRGEARYGPSDIGAYERQYSEICRIMSGFSFEDVNTDGTYTDGTDIPLPDVPFMLSGYTDQSVPVNLNGVSNAYGDVFFTGLESGTYTVIRPPLSGYTATTPSSYTSGLQDGEVLVAYAGQSSFPQYEIVVPELNFGLYKPTCHLLVTSTADSGPGTLRNAVLCAQAGDTIRFAPSIDGVAIQLYTQLEINKGVIILGNGRGNTVLEATGEERLVLLNNTTGHCLSIRDLTLRNGKGKGASTFDWGGALLNLKGCVEMNNVLVEENTADRGGALYNQGGDLYLTNCELANNTATESDGGAIAHVAFNPAEIRYSIIRNNTAEASGGGIVIVNGDLSLWNSTVHDNTAKEFGGAITCHRNLNLYNSTLANNSSEIGGGIFGASTYSDSSTIDLLNTTITNNHASDHSGGMYLWYSRLVMNNTIVADNHAANHSNDGSSLGTAIGSGSYNCVRDTANFPDLAGVHNLWNADPLLNPLADNGGESPTSSLRQCSPAANTGNDTLAPLFDQRGFPRYGRTDIGAFELQTSVICFSEMHGLMFEDLNGNGLYEPNTEILMPGIEFRLTGQDDLGHQIDLLETTNSTGEFAFSQLRPGFYTLMHLPVQGYSATTPSIYHTDIQERMNLVAYIGQSGDVNYEVLIPELNFGVWPISTVVHFQSDPGNFCRSYPNPFFDQIGIEFMLPKDDRVSLDIYNIQGVHIENLYQGKVDGNEHYMFTFTPQGQPAGIYLYRLRTRDEYHSDMILMIR